MAAAAPLLSAVANALLKDTPVRHHEHQPRRRRPTSTGYLVMLTAVGIVFYAARDRVIFAAAWFKTVNQHVVLHSPAGKDELVELRERLDRMGEQVGRIEAGQIRIEDALIRRGLADATPAPPVVAAPGKPFWETWSVLPSASAAAKSER
jgi:hypothetical protein